MLITRVIDNFIAFTNYIMCAVTLRAAPTFVAFAIRATCLIAIQEVGADIVRTTSGVALEVVIAGVLDYFLPMQTF